jgi:hypothetical protein
MEPGIEVAPECIEASRWRRQIELAALLPRFLSGESLEEELERWPGAG